MTSSYVQVNPIGLPRGFQKAPWQNNNNNNITFASQDFPRSRSRVSCNLFGAPEKGEINEMFQQEQNQRIEEFKRKYTCFTLEEPINKTIVNNTVTVTATIIESESRLGESLIEKEIREHEIKINQRNKKTVSSERQKPYARQQQASITDYYSQRKTVVCNNSRTSDVPSIEGSNVSSHPVQENAGSEKNPTPPVASESLSPSIVPSTHHCEQEKSQEQIALHTLTTAQSAKLV